METSFKPNVTETFHLVLTYLDIFIGGIFIGKCKYNSKINLTVVQLFGQNDTLETCLHLAEGTLWLTKTV